MFESALQYLEGGGFSILRLHEKSYEEAINDFALDWPSLVAKWPDEEFKVGLSESQTKLLIACGEKSHPRFWKFLADESLLYTGIALPPIEHLSPKCIVVPSSACVAAMGKHKDFYNNFPLEHFGPIWTFNSNEVPFAI